MNKSDFLKTFLKQEIDNQCGTCTRQECVEYFDIPLTGKFSSHQHILNSCIGIIIQYCKNTQHSKNEVTSSLNVSVLEVEFLQYNIIHTSIDSVRVECQCNILKAYCSSLKHLIEYKDRTVSVGQDSVDISISKNLDSSKSVKSDS